MIVVDTSVWIELFRNTGTRVAVALERLIGEGGDLAITEVVLMELLAGAPRAAQAKLRARMLAFPVLRLQGLDDFEEAAAIYRACREQGRTLRSQVDCLIAVPTMRTGASLLHNDNDFDVIEELVGLRVEHV